VASTPESALAATPRYRCFCFAVPSKLLRKLAEKAGPDHQPALHRHAEDSARLRAGRSADIKARTATAPVAVAPGLARFEPEVTAYKRRVFDAGTGMDLPGKSVRIEGGKPSRDAAVNQVYDNTGIALDFYQQVFGRNSIDGRGMAVDSAVHFGRDFANAMWTGKQMVYGDGDQQVGGFTTALDIIAHELTHGVIEHLIPGGLGIARVPLREREFKEQTHVLKGQSGALNESFADVFGSMVKQWHAGQSVARANWLLGENMLAAEHGRAIRSLKDPGNRSLTWYDDDQFKSMDQYLDGADVHDSSGIPNHAFYLAAREIGGHSWEKTGPIWYEAFDGLKPRASFVDAARATVRVAAKRFGSKSKECMAVRGAWQSVKVLT
jgi:Zn-dependent metalloprotease